MLSFIIIGRNEGWKLTKCLQSVIDTTKYNTLQEYELIYVDSRSTDDSINRAKQYSKVKIIKLTGDYNAAIARNVGVQEAKGEVLFFIDADMEIQPDFLSLVYTEKTGLSYPFISGKFINYYYSNDELKSKDEFTENANDILAPITGGIFLITRDKWELVNGMRTKYKRSQDLDLGLRLSRKGFKLLRKKEIIAIHHTINYLSFKRMWQNLLLNKYAFYGRSMLYRDHILNRHIYKKFFRLEYTLVVFILLLILLIITSNLLFLVLYILITLVKSFVQLKSFDLDLLNRTLYFITRDLLTIIGFFVFWPTERKSIQYEIIKGTDSL